MRRWELWEGVAEDVPSSDAFFPEDKAQARQMVVDEGLTFVWSTTAAGPHDAMRVLHAYKGWEEYQPLLRADGTPHPEDEDDEVR